jgi:acyl dehydratase
MPVLDRSPDLLPLFGKAAACGFTKHGGELPETEYVLNRVRIDLDHLAAYDKVCGFRLSDDLPATYPHVLGFGLQTKLMTDPEFPFPLIGSVHVANRITVHRPLRVDDVLQLRVHAENLRDHRRGKQFDVVTTAAVDGEEAWRDVSTYLRRGGGSGGGSREHGSGEEAEPPRPVAYWRVPGDIGRRYAAVAGDANPIHLHPLTAKAFGFPRTIAHGMWVKARCLATLAGQLPSTFTVDVRFKKPVLLPAKVAFRASRAGDGWEFGLSDAKTGKPHLAGSLT